MKINFQQTQKSKTWIDFLQAHKTVILDSAIFKNLKRACLKKINTKKCARGPEVFFKCNTELFFTNFRNVYKIKKTQKI